MEVDIADLRKDANYLKSTNLTSLIQAANNLYAPETSEIPPNTTGEGQSRAAIVDESDDEVDDENIKVQEESIFRYVPHHSYDKGDFL